MLLTRAVYAVPPEVMEAMPDMTLIVWWGAGLDRIDLAAAARGIAVANMPDKLTEDAAEFAIGAIVVLQQHLMADDRSGVSALYTVLLSSHVASLIT